jgi:hypothetical protein
MAISKNTPEVKAAIVESVRNGAYAKHAALSANISEVTLYDWIGSDAQFGEAIHRARSQAKLDMVRVIRSAALDGDWKAAERYLARAGDGEFSEMTKTELSGANGGPIVVAEVPLDAERAEAVAAILKSTGAAG